jgi:hypothetical protein
LFPKDEGEDANQHSNLTIWEHSFKDIKQWVTSDSGDYFAYIVETTRVYVKSRQSQRIQDLFEEYLVFYENTHGVLSRESGSAAASRDATELANAGVSAPHVRRSSVIRLRDVTQERAALAAVIEEEKRDGSAGDTLKDGWEEFYSEEH